ncbi:MAG: hypothetical protein KF841_11790 [Phycisphaerae bacterium]|nr:hypothetical protein [Phycisphaerae bacterium]
MHFQQLDPLRQSVRPRGHTNACMIALCFLALTALQSAFAQAQPAASTRTPVDWLRFVPGDVRFYVEINDLVGLRRRLQTLGMWDVVRELASADRSPGARGPRLPGLGDEQAISLLIGRRGALFAPMSSQWRSGVLFAQLGGANEVQRWRTLWGARRLPDEGAVQCYLLDGGLRMAVLDQLMALGPADDPTNLWRRTVDLLAGRPGAHLRGQSEFASLFSRMSSLHDGIGYASWQAGDPFAPGGYDRIAVGFSIGDDELKCEIHGARTGAASNLIPCDSEAVRRLPADTIAAWSDSSHSWFGSHRNATGVALNEFSPLGLFLGMFSSATIETGKLEEMLGPCFTVAIGLDPNGPDASMLLVPQVVGIIQSREAPRVAEQFGVIADFVLTVARLTDAPTSAPAGSSLVERREFEGLTLRSVRIGTALADRLGFEFLKDIELCWAGAYNRLFVATSATRLQTVLKAWDGGGPALRTDGADSATDEREPVVRWGFVRGRNVSRMMMTWLAHLRKQNPKALRDDWWQQWAAERTRSRTRLGVGLRDSETIRGGATVLELGSASPALGILQVGDVILATGGRPLPTTQPAAETARRYNERGPEKLFRVTVLRNGRRVTFGIPVEPLDLSEIHQIEPIRAMRQLIVLLRRIESIRFEQLGRDLNRLHLRVRVEWERMESAETPHE